MSVSLEDVHNLQRGDMIRLGKIDSNDEPFVIAWSGQLCTFRGWYNEDKISSSALILVEESDPGIIASSRDDCQAFYIREIAEIIPAYDDTKFSPKESSVASLF